MDDPSYHNPQAAKLIALSALFGSVIVQVFCMAMGMLIMVQAYVVTEPVEGVYPGVAVFVQNLLLLVGSFVMRLGTIVRSDEDESMY